MVGGAGVLAEQFVEVVACSDIHALRRLVQNQNAGIVEPGEPMPDDEFLGVASGKCARFLVGVGGQQADHVRRAFEYGGFPALGPQWARKRG